MQNELPPDALEVKIRLGCGAVVGLAVGLFVGVFALELAVGWSWALGAVSTFVFALLALRFGDRFWLSILNALR